VARELTDEEVKRLEESATDYAARGATYRTELERVG
jgi:hypothetical protein